MAPDVAQKVDVVQPQDPIGVVLDDRLLPLEVQVPAELAPDAAEEMLDTMLMLQEPYLGYIK